MKQIKQSLQRIESNMNQDQISAVLEGASHGPFLANPKLGLEFITLILATAQAISLLLCDDNHPASDRQNQE